MSIQNQIQSINERSRANEMGFLVVAAIGAMVAVGFEQFIAAVAILVIYLPLSIGLKNWLNDWREARILEVYRFVHEPIYELQMGENDRYVFARSEEHRRRLKEAKNLLFEQGLISVEEVYLKNVLIKYTATEEECIAQQMLFCEQHLNDWAKTHGEKNQVFVKRWLNNQELDNVTTIPNTPSVSEATESGNFFTTQFPLLSRLWRNKEVVAK